MLLTAMTPTTMCSGNDALKRLAKISAPSPHDVVATVYTCACVPYCIQHNVMHARNESSKLAEKIQMLRFETENLAFLHGLNPTKL